MARIYMDNEEAQGYAWASQAALPNQTLWQASLPTRLFPNRSIRSANDPALAPRRWSLDSFWPGIVQTHRPLASRTALLLCELSEKINKLEANRRKDEEFLKTAIKEGVIRIGDLEKFILKNAPSVETRERAIKNLKRIQKL